MIAKDPALLAQPAPHSIPRTRDTLWVAASYLLVLLVAAWPRLLDLGRFVTEDEGNYWLKRSDLFLRAIQSGNFGATAITDHPGVTTMWLGSAGIVLRRLLFDAGIVTDQSFTTMLALMELPPALVHLAGVAGRLCPVACVDRSLVSAGWRVFVGGRSFCDRLWARAACGRTGDDLYDAEPAISLCVLV